MPTVAEVTATPSSGLVHIDALLGAGPGWNWVSPARQTLYYSFALDAGRAQDIGSVVAAAPVAFTIAQQDATVQVLQQLGAITGIRFEPVASGADADIHLGAADILAGGISGLTSSRWSYSYSGETVVSYSADSWVYLDNAEFAAANAAPVPGSAGFEVLLHELAHSLGLKHPFEDGITLPPGDDDTSKTLMSYQHLGGPYDRYAPYDIAALLFLYGGDGLGGKLGPGSAGVVLAGTQRADTLRGGDGDDVLIGSGGDDLLVGGAGLDSARYATARGDYQVGRGADGRLAVSARIGGEGIDTLQQVERLVFGDQALAFDLDGHAGTTASFLGAVFGREAVEKADYAALYAGIGLAALDAGTDAAALMQLALDVRLGPYPTPEALVTLLYTNLAGAAPGGADLDYWTGTLASGQFTPVTLALMAAALDLNASNIDLVGLATDGLPYLPA